MQRKGKSYIVFSASLLLLGILFILFGLFSQTAFPKENSNWDKTIGIITSFKGVDGWDESTAPIVEYTVDNKKYSVVSLMSYNGFLGPKTGTEKVIKYDPLNPADSMVVENFTPIKLLTYFNILTGLLLVVFAIYNFSHIKKNR